MKNCEYFLFCASLFGIVVGVLTYAALSGLILETAILAGIASISGAIALMAAIRFGVWGDKP